MQQAPLGLFIILSVFAIPTLCQQQLEHDEEGYVINPDLPPEAYDISVPEELMDALFKKFDLDNDTVVTKEELLKFSRRARALEARREAKETLLSVDSNKDKRISWAELGPTYEDSMAHMNEKMQADAMLDQEIAKAKFDAADEDGDGLLGPKETMEFLHPSMTGKVIGAAVAGTIKEHDKNNDGIISLEEFYYHDGDYSESMNSTFNRMDIDGDGHLNFDELKKYETRLYLVEEAQDMIFDLADKDKDGKLTAEEFEAAKKDIAAHEDNGLLHHWGRHMEL